MSHQPTVILKCCVLCWGLQHERDRDILENTTKGHQGSGAFPVEREAERPGAAQQAEGNFQWDFISVYRGKEGGV